MSTQHPHTQYLQLHSLFTSNLFEKIRHACCVFLCLWSSVAYPCTSMVFDLNGQTYFAKTYDWDKEYGYLYTNKRGVQKSTLKALPTDVELEWVSKYGSITFNQYGRELPNSGMNEAGLVVEVMVLQDQAFPLPAQKASLNESQWVQYILDTSATLEEAKIQAQKVRISKILIPLHYMVCDRLGECGVFEHVGRQMQVYQNEQLPHRTLTNSRYAESLSYLQGFAGFGGRRPLPVSSLNSLDRFVNATAHAKAQSTERDPSQFGFSGLLKVTGSTTQWQMVYEPSNLRFHYFTKSSKSIKTLEIDSRHDFSCATEVMSLPIINAYEGDVREEFSQYSSSANTEMVRKSLGGKIPESLLQRVIGLPASTKCVQP